MSVTEIMVLIMQKQICQEENTEMMFHVVNYSTVTDLAKLRGWSTSNPLQTAIW
ncbi:hypothetical protein C7382_10291 [Porphyromonas loveana]|uniref:Uncharacterized protein n=1 Tax=Porphyromonas loveana TaxID=1884669 RepID=A0A2U1FPE4_9PORP|nr:hypothetical protein C7382_10291 [Porphyromonas loveana]